MIGRGKPKVRFEGVAVVVGGGSGIGEALARRLAEEATHVVVVDRDADRAERVAFLTGDMACAEACDAGDSAAVEDLAERVAERLGPIRLWINTAGRGHWGDALGASEAVWRRLMDENYWPVVWPTMAAYRRMREQPPLPGGCRGRIVNLASASAVIATPTTIPYTAAKHAVAGFTLALREEAAPSGVRLSLACPGPVETPFHERLIVTGAERSAEATVGRQAPRGCLTADEVAEATLAAARRDQRVAVLPAALRRQWRMANWFPASLRGPMQRMVANMRRRQRDAE